MGAEEILARLDAARTVKAEAGGASFTLRLPSPYEARRLALSVKGAGDAAAQEWMRALVAGAIVDWSGVTVDMVVGDGDQAALAYAPDLVAPLLENQLGILDQLAQALQEAQASRRAALEDSRKN